jgi:hypothetical protein
MIQVLLIALPAIFLPFTVSGWGFYAHERINKNAVFQQPTALYAFYKQHIRFIVEESVTPDKRRFASEQEAPRHYIDIDYYGEYPFDALPREWNAAVEKYTEDTLREYGTAPWHVVELYYRLTRAFKSESHDQILRISADLGHYIADLNSPLHTTLNYNGQLTGQVGIHALWESRLPELFAHQYDLFVEPPYYIADPLEAIFEIVLYSHRHVDTLLQTEREVFESFPKAKIYTYEERGQSRRRVHSVEYCRAYHDAMDGMVEHFMQKAIRDVASFWYSAWKNAGSPELGFSPATDLPTTIPRQEYLEFDPNDYKGRPDM